jgi:hypothetical protein
LKGKEIKNHETHIALHWTPGLGRRGRIIAANGCLGGAVWGFLPIIAAVFAAWAIGEYVTDAVFVKGEKDA